MTNKLQAKVKAVNAAMAAVNEWHPRLREFFAQFVGQKILKADGSLLGKVDKLVKELGLPNKHNLQVFRAVSQYALMYTVKTSEMDSEHTCLYYEIHFGIGNLENGVLANLSDKRDIARADYTVEEIMRKQDICKDLREQLNKAVADLWPFGEYER